MTKAARSVSAFDLYLFVLGPILLIAPNLLLRTFGLAESHDVWIRVVGMLVVLLGYYYSRAARAELTSFFHWTVHARGTVVFFFIAFVVLGLAPPTLILFGVIDAAAATWTALALRADC